MYGWSPPRDLSADANEGQREREGHGSEAGLGRPGQRERERGRAAKEGCSGHCGSGSPWNQRPWGDRRLLGRSEGDSEERSLGGVKCPVRVGSRKQEETKVRAE